LATIKNHRPNLSDIAYQEIKEMIFLGTLAQGEKILLDKLSSKLNLSITPIREALNKLAQEDLVQIKPRTSHVITSLNEQDIGDILELREMLETFALKTAGSELSKFPIETYRKLFSNPSQISCPNKFNKIDVQFHETIINMSRNKKLRKLFNYNDNLVCLLSHPASSIEGRIETAASEHLNIIEAIEANNVELAVKHLAAHLKGLKTALAQTHSSSDQL